MREPGTASVRIKSDERTFKNLGDEILRMIAANDQQALQRSALINSARSYIEIRIIEEGYHPEFGYRPLGYYMTADELEQPFANMDIYRLKVWLQHNLNIFEKKDKGGVNY
jgi:hypothetical protein